MSATCFMNREDIEKDYWNKSALDPDVDVKYISDIDKEPYLEKLGTLKGKVLDIGCGVGRLMKSTYYGIDISENMLKIAKKRLPKATFKLCNGRSIPFDDNYFDNTYAVLLFQHIPFGAVKDYISEANRVLKKGGSFTFQYIADDDNKDTGSLSFNHNTNDMLVTLLKNNFWITKFSKGDVHPLWTWITAVKDE